MTPSYPPRFGASRSASKTAPSRFTVSAAGADYTVIDHDGRPMIGPTRYRAARFVADDLNDAAFAGPRALAAMLGSYPL